MTKRDSGDGEIALYPKCPTAIRASPQGDDYATLKPAIAIHLLDFALFEDEDQGIWCFELRDREQHEVRLGEELQFNLIELPKADRLGAGSPALAAWVAFLKHWQEEQRMIAIMDEKQFRKEAVEEGLAEGRAEGWAEGLAEGQAEGQAEGLAQGTLAGQTRLLERLLTARFGPLDAATHARLQHASLSELEQWTDRLLDAPDLHSVLQG